MRGPQWASAATAPSSLFHRLLEKPAQLARTAAVGSHHLPPLLEGANVEGRGPPRSEWRRHQRGRIHAPCGWIRRPRPPNVEAVALDRSSLPTRNLFGCGRGSSDAIAMPGRLARVDTVRGHKKCTRRLGCGDYQRKRVSRQLQ